MSAGRALWASEGRDSLDEVCDDPDGDQVQREPVHRVQQAEQDDLCLRTRATKATSAFEVETGREGRCGRT